jgi:Smg protein
MRRLNAETRGFLLSLEQSGVLDASTREVVIDRVMALEVEEIDLNHMKWVTMMVLCNQPGQEYVYAWMEDVVLNGVDAKLQ